MPRAASAARTASRLGAVERPRRARAPDLSRGDRIRPRAPQQRAQAAQTHANAAPIRVDAPHLRIVDPDLVASVDAQRSDRRERYLRKTDGRLLRRPAPKAIKHVLSGLLRCRCGASFEAQGSVYGRRKGGVYVCSAARRKGRAVCASDVHLPAVDTEARILDAVERELLDALVFSDAIDVAVERLSREAPQTGGLVAERDQLARELGNLIALAAAGSGESSTLIAEIKRREARKAEIERLLTRPAIDRDGLRRALDERIADWKRLLRSRPTHGQRVLRTLLDGPITIGAPEGDAVTWEAQPNPWGALGGILSMSNPRHG